MSFLYKWAFTKIVPSALTVGKEDPYFEQAADAELGKSKKHKKKRKGIPSGLSHNNAKVLKKFRRRAYRLDLCFQCCCGIQLGWAGLIGLIPGFGDIMAASFALMLVKSARHVDGGLPPEIYSKMIANVMFDFLIGLIPVVGDLINIAYKCNSRNCLILEHYLTKTAISKVGEEALTEPALSTPPADLIYGNHNAPSSQQIAQRLPFDHTNQVTLSANNSNTALVHQNTVPTSHSNNPILPPRRQ